jgi:flagellar motor protein MotB
MNRWAMVGNKTIIKRTLLMAGVLFIAGTRTWAGIPSDSVKSLLVGQQKRLTEIVKEYSSQIEDYRMDILNLEEEKEWLEVKIERITDQGRQVPVELTKAVSAIKGKLVFCEREIERLSRLNEGHIREMQNLDARVKKKFGNPPPEWWVWDEQAYALVNPYRPKFIRKLKQDEMVHVAETEESHRESVAEIPDRSPDYSSNHSEEKSTLVAETLEEKIKSSDLDGWVDLSSGEHGMKLEVQLPILFGEGKTDLADDYRTFLEKFSTLIKPYDVVVEVAGYPDGKVTGKKDFVKNMAMGTKRAASVVKEMMDMGVPASSFKIISERGNDSSGESPLKSRVEVNVYLKNGG